MAEVDPRNLRARLQRFGLQRDRLNISLARAAGISHGDLHALEHLEAAGPLSPGQLGSRLGLTSGAVTALVDRLERAGWVSRSPHPRDRRSVVVGLTGRVSAAGAAHLARYEHELEALAAELTPLERDAFAGFLDRAAHAAGRHADRLRGA